MHHYCVQRCVLMCYSLLLLYAWMMMLLLLEMQISLLCLHERYQ